MTTKKLILSVAVASLIFSGCGDKEESKTTTTQVVKEAVKVAPVVEKKEPIKEEIVKTTESVKESISNIDGAKLYRVCAGCHGATAQNVALGKSAVIKGWSADKIESALNGYKNGTYGGMMKAVMAGQVKALNDNQIKELSVYISKF